MLSKTLFPSSSAAASQSDSVHQIDAAGSHPESLKSEYNPNDPSSGVHIDNIPSNTATAGGQAFAGAPQHRGKSEQSAALSDPAVTHTEDENALSDVFFTG